MSLSVNNEAIANAESDDMSSGCFSCCRRRPVIAAFDTVAVPIKSETLSQEVALRDDSSKRSNSKPPVNVSKAISTSPLLEGLTRESVEGMPVEDLRKLILSLITPSTPMSPENDQTKAKISSRKARRISDSQSATPEVKGSISRTDDAASKLPLALPASPSAQSPPEASPNVTAAKDIVIDIDPAKPHSSKKHHKKNKNGETNEKESEDSAHQEPSKSALSVFQQPSPSDKPRIRRTQSALSMKSATGDLFHTSINDKTPPLSARPALTSSPDYPIPPLTARNRPLSARE